MTLSKMFDPTEIILKRPQSWKIGDKVILRGNIFAGQNHQCRWFEFPEEGKIFEIMGFIGSDRLILMADGYGNFNKQNAYGNGRLFVSVENCEKCG